ncbi:MAG: SagB/ThcOx family dehydrogenase [Chloroflexi bacterium]|nr:MAG: SagB/ThcOx family dehydrogenase [Chloroflexota bacterium]
METQAVTLRPLQASAADSVEQVILRRGSTRRFLQEAIAFEQLSTILIAALHPLAADFLRSVQGINTAYLVVNAVDSLLSGAYVLDPQTRELTLLRSGAFRSEAAYLCLEQPLLGQAAAVIFLMADINQVTSRLGPRGYRAALLEGGVAGGRLYLAAYSLKLGATGTTFYDDEVTKFFSPHAAGKSPTLAIGIGRDPRFLRSPNNPGAV